MARSRMPVGVSESGASKSRRQSRGERPTVFPSLGTGGALTNFPWAGFAAGEPVDLQIGEKRAKRGEFPAESGVGGPFAREVVSPCGYLGRDDGDKGLDLAVTDILEMEKLGEVTGIGPPRVLRWRSREPAVYGLPDQTSETLVVGVKRAGKRRDEGSFDWDQLDICGRRLLRNHGSSSWCVHFR